MTNPVSLRRKFAGEYLVRNYGFGAASTLSKLASTGGGPEYHLVGATPVYTIDALDVWAREKLGEAKKSTSEYLDASPEARAKRAPKRKAKPDHRPAI